ncbi:ATP-dependent zinc metalloproteinase [hydrothermal vent metagenome]|uniref:ATP-dependent zinc metalloproteinase n=1 Tax=hydrothermal vent metagenome TaxID=652676 RepID=A0A1W1CZ90_9ZZZZ
MLLAGMALCDIKYSEHSSNAKEDLTQAKEIVMKMCSEYGMASTLLPNEEEQELLLERFYRETKDLLHSMEELVAKVEEILFERESIGKNEVKSYLDAIF